MSYLLTLAILVFLAAIVVLMLWASARRAAAKREEEKLVAKRAGLEEEVLERLARIRKKKQEAVADAVRDDPERAAKVVRNMMRNRK